MTTQLSVAVGVSAVAVLLAPGGAAPARLAALAGPPATAAADPPAVRRAWLLIAATSLTAVGWAAAGGPGVLIGLASATGGLWMIRRAAREDETADAAALAGTWELLAVCLRAGLPVPTAVAAAAAPLAGGDGRGLRRVAGLLTLGADPAEAWGGVGERPALAVFARAAGRSASTGAALAQVVLAESARLRAGLVDAAEAGGQRAAVLITGPLGLCFLPAFLVLGVAPVVIGLATEALARW